MSPPKPVDIPSFCATQLHLLDAELQSEVSETSSLINGNAPTSLQRAGMAITNLVINSQRTGLGGKTVLELTLDGAIGEGDLPEHGIRVGDIVLVATQPAGSARKKEVKELEDKGSRGVVTRVTKVAVSVALDREDDDADANLAGRLWLVKLSNDVTFKRMNQAIGRLQRMGKSQYSSFVRVLFGLSSPSPLSAGYENENVEWVDPSLNQSQKEAIKFAVASREIALIHGPPGVRTPLHHILNFILILNHRLAKHIHSSNSFCSSSNKTSESLYAGQVISPSTTSSSASLHIRSQWSVSAIQHASYLQC